MPDDFVFPTPEEERRYNDLYDLGRRAGVGVELWSGAVRRQLVKVVEVNRLHRENHENFEERTTEPGDTVDPPPNPNALAHLQVEVYYLVMATKRIHRFVGLMAKFTDDPQLVGLLADFDAAFPDLTNVRDYYEHLDEYVLGEGRHQTDTKSQPATVFGRVSPVLQSEWYSDDVSVCFGDLEFNVVKAALAAIDMADAAAPIYDDRVAEARPHYLEPPGPDDPDDGIERTFCVSQTVTARVGREKNGVVKMDTMLRRVYVRPSTPDEIARRAEKRARGEEVI